MRIGKFYNDLLILLFLCLLLGPGVGHADTTVPLTIEENDGSPSVKNVKVIKVDNGSLTDNGGGSIAVTTGSPTSPGGANTQVQYNSSGSFAADAGLTFNKATSTVTAVNLTDTGTTTFGTLVGDTVTVNAGAWSLASAMTMSQGTKAWSQSYTGTVGTGFSYVANSLTTGKILNATSNSADTSTRKLIQMTNTNTAATGTTSLSIEQNATLRALFLNQKANGALIAADLSNNIATDQVLFGFTGTSLDTATNVVLDQISTTPANVVAVTAFKVERGANDAMLKYDETLDKWQLDQGQAGGLVSISSVVSSSTTTSAVANTTAETNFSQNYSLPANSFQAGEVVRVTARGIYSTTGAAPTLTLNVKFGSTVLATTAAQATNANLTNLGWEIRFDAICLVTGAAGSVEAQGMFTRALSGNTTVEHWDMENTAPIAVDTTGAQTVQVSAQWSAANASNTISLRQLIVEEL
jgi:hypothetical protein